jgi:chemotaxis protein methyltransferase CheR
MPDDTGPDPSGDAQEFWEQHYGSRVRVRSGRPNARLVEVASELRPGRALDLGCGEGADALWLAEQGWQVVAVDVSATALQRAAADARERDLLAGIDFQRHDLSDSFPSGTFDLVSVQFLHSGSMPPWSWRRDHAVATVTDNVIVLRREGGDAAHEATAL